MKFANITVLLFATLFSLSQSAWAIVPSDMRVPVQGQQSSLYNSGISQHNGKIAAIDMTRQRLAVGGENYKLSSTVKVHDSAGHWASRYELRKGQTIRFSTVQSSGGGTEIVEIWMVKPAGK